MIVVISGSWSIKSLPTEAIARIDKIMELGANILIGDAPGVDAAVGQYGVDITLTLLAKYFLTFDGWENPKLEMMLKFFDCIPCPCITWIGLALPCVTRQKLRHDGIRR